MSLFKPQHDPGKYQSIPTRFWLDESTRKLSGPPPCGRYLMLYLRSCPDSTPIPGLLRVTEGGLAEALGWTLEGFRDAWGEPSREGLVEADWTVGLVWIKDRVREVPPAGPNVIKGWRRIVNQELPECDLLRRALLSIFGSLSEVLRKPDRYLRSFREGFPELFQDGSGDGHPNPTPNPTPKDPSSVSVPVSVSTHHPLPPPRSEPPQRPAAVVVEGKGGSGQAATADTPDLAARKAELVRQLRERRRDRLPRGPANFCRDEKFDAMIEDVRKPLEQGGCGRAATWFEDLLEACQAFLADKTFKPKHWPLPVFCSPGVYRCRLPEHAPPAPMPDPLAEQERQEASALGWIRGLNPLEAPGRLMLEQHAAGTDRESAEARRILQEADDKLEVLGDPAKFWRELTEEPPATVNAAARAEILRENKRILTLAAQRGCRPAQRRLEELLAASVDLQAELQAAAP